MLQNLEFKSLNAEDIKFLKSELYSSVRILFFLSLFSIVFPGFCIYRILIDSAMTDKTYAFFMVIICFGFWTYLTLKGIKVTIKEKQNLFSQRKVTGNLEILDKEIITIKGDESDTYSYELSIYSDLEGKNKNISIMKKDYNKIKVGDVAWIEYYLDCNYIKTLKFGEQNMKYKKFIKQ